MDLRRGLPAGLVCAVFLLGSASLLNGATFTVTTTADSGAGSYRQATIDANANPGPDTIAFNIPGPGPYVITPTAPWGAFTEPIVIDGTTQPGYAGTPIIELADFSGGGISLAGGDSTVRGLCIRGFNTAIQMVSSGNHVEGCYVGTDVTGTIAAPNGTGFDINSGADNNTVGGSTAAQRNVISGNGTGVFFIGNSGNVVFGNYIGTTASGGAAIPNGTGISGTGTTNLTIGGPGAGEGNVVAGNTGDGILLSSGSGAKIQGNLIGVDATGSVALPNDYGIDFAGHDGALIGGDFNAGEGNLISSNVHYGVYLGGSNNTVTGNTIGVDAAGQQPMGNGYGVFIAGAANDNVIGGITNGLGNAIAWNDTGVLNGGVQNAIRGNAIFFNAKLGIDNYPFGVDNNDPLDVDTGANQLQNFPFIASVDYGTTSLTVHGILKSSPNTTFDLDFYESPSCTPRPRDLLQSAYFLGTQQVTTDGAGDAPFDILLSDANAAGQPPISVTATDPNGNTSEFSQNVIYASSPRSGPPSGGVQVLMTGVHFLAGATVTFGGVAGTNVIVTNENDMKADAPALPAATVNDIVVTNTDGTAGTLRKAWIVDFLDVPPAQQFYNFVTTLVSNGITAGVGGGNYGVDSPTLRQQMAVFLLKGRHGLCYVPPPCTGLFPDVPCPSLFADWIEALYSEGITGGCGSGNYCPTNPVRRDQMAVFLLKAEHGPAYVPPPCAGVFPDVPCPGLFSNWIEQLSGEAITGGCGGGLYCPQNPNTRGQMAVFLTKTFGLQ